MKSIGLTAILLMLASGTALAAEDGGFYLGAGVGQFNLEEDDFAELTADDFDADDTSLKLFAGWRFNPYIAGTPVFDEDLFFGRERLAKATLGWLASRSVLLTGERRIGKTSFLHHLERGLITRDGNGPRAIPVFVDLEAVPAEEVFRALIDETIEALGVPCEARRALRAGANGGRYTDRDFCSDTREVVARLGERAGGPVRLVLLIDEIDAPFGGAPGAVDAWLGPLLHLGPGELRIVAAGASVKFTVTLPTGATAVVSATSGSDGLARATYRIAKGKGAAGNYGLRADAALGGGTSSASGTFRVL